MQNHVRKALTLLLMALPLLLLAPLSACGKKPGMVDPPPEVKQDHFPRTYPDASTDPAATVPPPPAVKRSPSSSRF